MISDIIDNPVVIRKQVLNNLIETQKNANDSKRYLRPGSPEMKNIEDYCNEIDADIKQEQDAIKNKRAPKYMYMLSDIAWEFPDEMLMSNLDTTKRKRGKNTFKARVMDKRMVASRALDVYLSLIAEEVPLFMWEIQKNGLLPIRRGTQGLDQLCQEQYVRKVYDVIGKTFPEGSVRAEDSDDMIPTFKLPKYQLLQRIELEPLAFEHLGLRKDKQFKRLLVEILKSYADVTLLNPVQDLSTKDHLVYVVQFKSLDGHKNPALFRVEHDTLPHKKTSVYTARWNPKEAAYERIEPVDISVLYDSKKLNQEKEIARRIALREEGYKRAKLPYHRG